MSYSAAVWWTVVVGVLMVTVMSLSVAAINPPLKMPHRKMEATGSAPSTYTTLSVNQDYSSVSWMTYGPEAHFDYGQMTPFKRVCAVAGKTNTNGTGHVFVLDAIGGTGNAAVLHIYKQNATAYPSIAPWKTVELAKVVSADVAPCHMAVLGDFVYLGTQASSIYAQVNWKTQETFQGWICTSMKPTVSVTATNDFAIISQDGCFAGYNKDGQMVIDGGETHPTFVAGTNAHIVV